MFFFLIIIIETIEKIIIEPMMTTKLVDVSKVEPFISYIIPKLILYASICSIGTPAKTLLIDSAINASRNKSEE